MTTSTVTANATGFSLEIRRNFHYPRQQIFRAWSDPKAMMVWFHPGEQITTALVEVDLRVGGRYRIVMQAPNQEQFKVSGIYRVVDAPAKLVFTWRWEYEPTEPETEVTIELIERAPSETELILRHTGFRSEQECNNHQTGWQNILDLFAVVGPG